MPDFAVRVHDLGKRYGVAAAQPERTVREAVTDTLLAPARRAARLLRGDAYGASDMSETFWALRGVRFDVARGEVVGIIGRNGAGKTTLLRILSRVAEPTEGWAELHGRVGALLEVGTGFHPELTGRENVYLNGTILGMKRAEIDARFDDIIKFSGVERFVDTPVKHFSTGMRVRLAFAVAAHLDPDILIVDEVLAVGDAAFQKKCLGKMQENSEEGRTVLLVSHDMTPILRLCNRGILLEQGRVAAMGNVDDVVATYMSSAIGRETVSLDEVRDRKGNGLLRFRSFHLEDSKGAPRSFVASGDAARLVLEYEAREIFDHVLVHVVVTDRLGQKLLGLSNRVTGDEFGPLPLRGSFVCDIPRIPLLPDQYHITVEAVVNRTSADHLEAGAFTVSEGDFFGSGKSFDRVRYGYFLTEHRWALRPTDAAHGFEGRPAPESVRKP